MAVAAQTKNDKINNDSQVAKNTKDLTTEQDILNLLTKKFLI